MIPKCLHDDGLRASRWLLRPVRKVGRVYAYVGQRERDAAKVENARLRIALHDAIRRPLGVTPDSAVEFYDQRMADEAEERRSGERN